MSIWEFVEIMVMERKCVEGDANGTLELNRHLSSRQWGLGGHLENRKRKRERESMLLQKTLEEGFSRTDV